MTYKLDLRKSISRATIFRVLKDCRNGRKQENKRKSGPPKLEVKTTKIRCKVSKTRLVNPPDD